MAYDIEVKDYSGTIHEMTDAKGIKWSTHYGSNGSGYGYLKFYVERPTGTRYTDLGFAYEITLRKNLRVSYHGMIREISEVSKSNTSRIEVSALGFVIAAEDCDDVLRAFCDTNLNKWQSPSEIPGGLYRPDGFATFITPASGIGLSATTTEVEQNAFTETRYDFYPGEVAERVKFDVHASLGKGIVFDAEVLSIDEPNKYVIYKNFSDESLLAVGMTVVNVTKNTTSVISAVDVGLDRLTLTTSPASWEADDEMYVAGPPFQATVLSTSGVNFTYSNDVGEGSLANGQTLVNVTKKNFQTIVSFNTTSNSIEVPVNVNFWSPNDVIMVTTSVFSATISSVSTDTIAYSGSKGERIVDASSGWVIYNVTLSEYATVLSWPSSGQVQVTDSAEISSWVSTNEIAIWTPYALEIKDSSNVTIWPVTDWRDGTLFGSTLGLDLLSVASPTGFKAVMTCYIAGSGDETSFFSVSAPKVYSTEFDSTMETISKALLPLMTAIGMSSSELHIDAITTVIEPTVFEFNKVKKVLSTLAAFGSQNSKQVAWGVRLDDTKTFFLQEYPDTTRYYLGSPQDADIEVSADIGDSIQRIRPTFQRILGDRQIDNYIDYSGDIFGSYRLSRVENIDNVFSSGDAALFVQEVFDSIARPPIGAKYSVKGNSITDVTGGVVPFDEIVATGEFMEVEDFRSSLTGEVASDLSANWARDRVVVVEVDVDSASVKLTPGKALKTFEVYMAELSRIANL